MFGGWYVFCGRSLFGARSRRVFADRMLVLTVTHGSYKLGRIGNTYSAAIHQLSLIGKLS